MKNTMKMKTTMKMTMKTTMMKMMRVRAVLTSGLVKNGGGL
jgi:hypothetical protein